MSNTPKTDKLFFPYGRDHTAAASPSFLTCWTEYELLEKENAAQLAELHRISEALGTTEGHSSVTHIEILKGENATLRKQLVQTLAIARKYEPDERTKYVTYASDEIAELLKEEGK